MNIFGVGPLPAIAGGVGFALVFALSYFWGVSVHTGNAEHKAGVMIGLILGVIVFNKPIC